MMNSVPDSEFRLRLRVALKLMTLVAVVVFMGVTVRYFAGDADPSPVADRREVDVSDLDVGEARTILWGSRPVIVLRRQPAGDAPSDTGTGWFVGYASDTVRGCPIRWHEAFGQFRSSCGDTRYDAAGQPLGTDAQALATPPYHIIGDEVLVLGEE